MPLRITFEFANERFYMMYERLENLPRTSLLASRYLSTNQTTGCANYICNAHWNGI